MKHAVHTKRLLVPLLLCGAILLCLAHTATAQDGLRIERLRYGLHADKTRIVLELGGPAGASRDFRVGVSADPYAIVVDMRGAQWAVTSAPRPEKPLKGAQFQGALDGADAGLARIVLPTNGPALVKSAFMIPLSAKEPERLVIDIAGVDKAAFDLGRGRVFGTIKTPISGNVSLSDASGSPADMKKGPETPHVAPAPDAGGAAGEEQAPIAPQTKHADVKPDSKSASKPAAKTPPRTSGLIPIPQPQVTPPHLPFAAGKTAPIVDETGKTDQQKKMDALIAAQTGAPEAAAVPSLESLASPKTSNLAPASGTTPKSVYTVAIDAGHGGVDPGATSGDIKEKDITLATARTLRAALEKTGRYKVRLVRESDVYLKLSQRVALARAAEADLFISIHADSINQPNVSGASIYTLSDRASDAQTERLAARENRADLISGIDLSTEDQDVANILIDLSMRETMNQSKFFANSVVDSLRGLNVSMLENPHRFAGFAVLKAPDVPSVLIEIGFVSNKTEARRLMSADYQGRIAQAVLQGIDGYFSTLEKNRNTQ